MISSSLDAVMGRTSDLRDRSAEGASRQSSRDFADSLQAAERGTAARDRDQSKGVTLGTFLGMRSRPATTYDRGADWVAQLPPEGRQYVDEIEAAAAAAGIDPTLLAAVVWAESDFIATAESHAGALGLTQLMPGTAEILGVDPLDPAANLRGGAQFLADMIARYEGDVSLALAAYNAGPGTVDRAGGAPEYTLDYIARVLGNLETITGGDITVAQMTVDVDGGDVATVMPPAPPSAAVAGSGAGTPSPAASGAIADRIMAAVEQLRNQPPPQRMIVEIPELAGRITVALRDGVVVLSQHGVAQEAMASWLPAVEAALERHGLDTRRDPRDRRPDRDEPSEAIARRRRDVIMEGADQ